MNAEQFVLNYSERIGLALRCLYQTYGYTQYKMSKFEEYDLYARNKDFLVSDNVITFNDTNGKLMALKPDVTLSIVRNSRDLTAGVHKVYYAENVYRVAKSSRSFKEIMQAGLECIGQIDSYAISEVVILAAESLRQISDRCVLNLSHLGIVAALVARLNVLPEYHDKLLKCIGSRSLHELSALCREADADPNSVASLLRLLSLHGAPEEVLSALEAIGCPADALTQLRQLVDDLNAVGLGDMLQLDFSVVNDMNYYNGIVFKGFVDGVPASVLSGGQYDRLMEKMGRRSGAIGFAVYLDALERLDSETAPYDVDMVLLYDEATDRGALCRAVKQLAGQGLCVTAQRQVPEKLKYRKLAKLNGNEVEILETVS